MLSQELLAIQNGSQELLATQNVESGVPNYPKWESGALFMTVW